ncbi:MAG: serine hydrolase domain-containing protein [Acidobacteriota bacterium]
MKSALRLSVAVLLVAMISAQAFPTSTSAARIDIERVVAELEPAIERAMLEGRIPSATVALVSGDQIIWTGAYGQSNLWARTLAVPSTVYLIGSTFKAMATVALLQLMEQGKFKLDDRVSDYLTEFKIQGEDPTSPVTFRHLLTHVSGLPADFGPHPVWGDTVPPSLEDYLKTSLKVTRPPMQKEEYSNMAYTLVGYLVQKFSGVPFKKYIKDNLFTPLEMTSTDFYPNTDMEERLAIPYAPDQSGRLRPAERLKANVWPAGLVYGTVLNQANWIIANLNGGMFKGRRIIGEQTLEQMMTRQYDKFKGPVEGLWGGAEAGFGLTWWVDVRNGDRYFAHSGSVPGYTAFLLGNRDQKLGFAILTNGNRAHPHLIKLADRAMDLMKANAKAN